MTQSQWSYSSNMFEFLENAWNYSCLLKSWQSIKPYENVELHEGGLGCGLIDSANVN